MTRPSKAGRQMAMAIIEMVHLMYQAKTALHFYDALLDTLQSEYNLRIYNSSGIKNLEPP